MNLKESLDNAKGHQIIPKNPLCCTQPPSHPEEIAKSTNNCQETLKNIEQPSGRISYGVYKRERERERVAWLAGNESGW